MDGNPSWFASTGQGKDKVAGQSTSQHPVENVSWLDAVKFCNKLSEMEGRKPFYEINEGTVRVPDWKASGYRLPTEAEWEYACGGDPADLNEHAWFEGNSGSVTHPVGKKLRTGSAFMTCPATSGSGAGTLTTKITTSNRRPTTRRVRPRLRTGCSGAGVGATTRATAGRRTDTGSRPTTGTSTWASAWPQSRNEPGTEPSSAGWPGVVAEPTPDRAGGRWRSRRSEPEGDGGVGAASRRVVCLRVPGTRVPGTPYATPGSSEDSIPNSEELSMASQELPGAACPVGLPLARPVKSAGPAGRLSYPTRRQDGRSRMRQHPTTQGHRIKIGGLGQMVNPAFGKNQSFCGRYSHLCTIFVVALVIANKYNLYVQYVEIIENPEKNRKK